MYIAFIPQNDEDIKLLKDLAEKLDNGESWDDNYWLEEDNSLIFGTV